LLYGHSSGPELGLRYSIILIVSVAVFLHANAINIMQAMANVFRFRMLLDNTLRKKRDDNFQIVQQNKALIDEIETLHAGLI